MNPAQLVAVYTAARRSTEAELDAADFESTTEHEILVSRWEEISKAQKNLTVLYGLVLFTLVFNAAALMYVDNKRIQAMSEINPVNPEYHSVEQTVFSSEPERLPPAAHAATEFEDDSDVELADDDVSEGPDGNLSGIDQ
jgi:hypothetical protein